ncbi:MAG: DNA cytosine methyltransferase [Prevotellaceae bacterium]|jgi:DNA (cytosine-5)-methyltransferase 1|nr:DNA cytosine methyltransferase [Prevotellaceae bacterium]
MNYELICPVLKKADRLLLFLLQKINKAKDRYLKKSRNFASQNYRKLYIVHTLNFIDLFAGAGGLSEGFIRAGYTPLAHIEMGKYACDTLKTRAAFHWVKANNQLQKYEKYLHEKQEKEDGSKLWEQAPKEVIDTVIQSEIGEKTIAGLFEDVDNLIGNKQIDIIVGGPPCQAYSVAGRARMGKAVEDDPRNELYKYYVKFLERYQPKMFVFENFKLAA